MSPPMRKGEKLPRADCDGSSEAAEGTAEVTAASRSLDEDDEDAFFVDAGFLVDAVRTLGSAILTGVEGAAEAAELEEASFGFLEAEATGLSLLLLVALLAGAAAASAAVGMSAGTAVAS